MSIRKRSWTTARGEQKEAWVVDYADTAGKRRLKTFQRKKDADAWWRKTGNEIDEGVHTPDSAHRRFLHRHVKANEIRHLTAPSSMLKIRLTSIQSSYLKGMRAHHSMPRRSRRDTPSSENRNLALERRG
jgi:hypothetical protein